MNFFFVFVLLSLLFLFLLLHIWVSLLRFSVHDGTACSPEPCSSFIWTVWQWINSRSVRSSKLRVWVTNFLRVSRLSLGLGVDAQFSREVWSGKTDSPVIVYWHHIINHCSRGRRYLFSFIRTLTTLSRLHCAVPAGTCLVDGSMLLPF